MAGALARVLAGQFFRFGLVGTLGFVVDAGLLAALQTGTSLGPYLGRLVSFTLAATVTWTLNRRFTFASTASARPMRQWLRYLAVSLLGAGTNYAIYVVLLRFHEATVTYSVLAVAAGSLGGLAVNFTTARRFVFAPPKIA